MNGKEAIMPVLALLAMLALALVTALLFFVEPPPGSKEALFTALGVLSTICTAVYSFYFGSSQGSRDKDKRREEG